MKDNTRYGKIIEVNYPAETLSYYRSVQKGTRGIIMGPNSMLTEHGRNIFIMDSTLKYSTPVKNARGLRQQANETVRKCISYDMVRGRKWIETGSDPEIFALDGNGEVFPAWKYLPEKAKTHGYSKPYWDGFQAEWTIKPDTCHSYTVDYVQEGLKNALAAAQKLDPKATLTWKPVLEIPDSILLNAENRYVEFGCAPSKNGYLRRDVVLKGIMARSLLVRFAGFHIHFGIPKLPPMRAKHIVKQLDRVVGTFFVAMLDGMDDPIRRQFYGRAGEYRLPNHGLEYRVLSSAVMAHPALTHLAFDMARATAMYAVGGLSLIDGEDAMFRECINNCDSQLARKLIEKNDEFYKALFSALYGESKLAFDLAEKSAKELLPITSMTDNWKLDKGWTRHSEGTNSNFTNTRDGDGRDEKYDDDDPGDDA
jgi:Phage phiEco32-like COOH.NH2 ligase-type 2